MPQHYGGDYDRAIASGGEDLGHWIGRRDTLLRYKPGGTVLDLGCSTGGFLATLKGPAWKLFGVEMSESVAKQAEAKCGAEVFVGDVLRAPFPSASFDAITCFHVFEHLYRPREVLAKVAKWLKPGGVFYAMMPNIDSASARIFKSYWFALELPRHLHHFSPASLKQLARSVGLQEVSVTTHRELFVEASLRYILDDGLRRIGIQRAPLARAKPAGLPWKVVRKGFRLTLLPLLGLLASLIGDGESIHAILRNGSAEGPLGPRS
jgi:SAM-dependent methyltransferase